MMTFEYALLRAVPRIERGEVANVGVIVYCQDQDYLAAAAHVDAPRLRALDPEVDVEAVCAAVDAIRAACDGAGPAGAGSKGERFRWVTAPRSTVVQPGPVHAGRTDDPAAELVRLLDRLVR
ncbi:MAG: DUF3037 domain-containing protein [Jiangellaceae bacterium]